jgi:hypothetical protein
MPMTGQGLKNVMTSDGTDFKECDYAKSEAKASEGKGGQAIEEGGGGNCGHIIIDIRFLVIMIAGGIPKNQTLWSQQLK